jgi:hypothetical protein
MDLKTRFKVGDNVFFLTENDNTHTTHIGNIYLLSGRIDNISIFYSSSHMLFVEYEILVKSYGKDNKFKIQEEYLSDNIGELLNRITDQSNENIRIKLTKEKND